MKKIALSPLVVVLGLVAAGWEMLPGILHADPLSPQIQCFQNAVSNPAILQELKAQNASANDPGSTFSYEEKLCSGTTDPQWPLQCYLNAMQPNGVLASVIAQNSEDDLSFMTDTVAVGYCHDQLPTAVQPDCVQAAQSDPDVLTAMKQLDNPAGVLESWYDALCRGAPDATSSITCYKQAMSNPDVFADIKQQNGDADVPQATEEAVVGLCGNMGP